MSENANTWAADLSKITDCLDILFAVLKRHPDFFGTNLAYDRNMMELLRSAAQCATRLNPNPAPYTIGLTPGWGVEYVESDDFGYDEAKVQSLRREIISKAAILESSALVGFRGMEEDLSILKNEDVGAFKKTVHALIVVSPFIYNHRGAPKAGGMTAPALEDAVEAATVPELENLYLDFFTDFLCPLFIGFSDRKGYGQVHEAARFVLNRFIEKQVLPATRLYANGSKALSMRKLILREVPRPFGLFRGMIGKDCSMVSVPFYALSENARVCWIWKGADESETPDGYVFIVDCRNGSEIRPYVVTVNGPTLNPTDAKAVLHQVARASGTDELYVPSEAGLPGLVNTEAVARAMNSLEAEPARVALPGDWERLEKFSDRTAVFRNYYRTGNIADARRICLETPGFIVSHWDLSSGPMYEKVSDHRDFPIFDRACVGEYVLSSHCLEGSPEKLLKLLHLEPAQVQTIRDLRVARDRRYISPDLFNRLSRTFGFTVGKLLDFKSTPLLVNSVRDLFEILNPHATDSEWAGLVQKTNRRLRIAIRDAEESERNPTDRLNDLISSKLSLPDVYLANYWEENSPFLFFEDGRVYHYRVHRYAKYFTSRATVGRFLDFLMGHKEVLSDIEPGAPSWQMFFEKAHDRDPEDPRLLKCLERVYVKRLAEKRQTVSDYDFAAALVSYCRVLGDRGAPVFYRWLTGQPRCRTEEAFRQLIGDVRPLKRLESYFTHSGFSGATLQTEHLTALERMSTEPGGQWITGWLNRGASL